MKKEGFSMWTFSKRGFLTLIALIWIAILGVISPAWFSIGVVLVTGTSKGIGVSLGSEGNLYFCAGDVAGTVAECILCDIYAASDLSSAADAADSGKRT